MHIPAGHVKWSPLWSEKLGAQSVHPFGIHITTPIWIRVGLLFIDGGRHRTIDAFW